ncbi:MAG: class I SAM-dependent RNA methyltransferase [Betaproteobacteria bacterium]|nr:class I SAM-dependent RNA methyltransferase [Betaproteobacteria bacterium]
MAHPPETPRSDRRTPRNGPRSPQPRPQQPRPQPLNPRQPYTQHKTSQQPVAPRPGAGLQLFAPCPRGLEPTLAQELTELGADACQPTGGGVAFSGDAALAMSVNLHSRIASRVLMRVAAARCRDEDELYKLVRRTEWERWFSERLTLRVDVSAHRSPLRSLNFAALRVKDAICDRFRELAGARPSVDTRSPDVRVFVFLDAIDATIYLDLSGESLFKRGWRGVDDSAGAAPLKENLAAGLLALAGWQPGTPLHDPLCGSGTLLIEAAQHTLGIAPGRERSFGFEKLKGFDAVAFANLKQAAEQKAAESRAAVVSSKQALAISGGDIDPRAVERTRRNLLRAGVPDGAVVLKVEDFGAPRAAPAHVPAPAPSAAPSPAPANQALPATPRGIIVTNPPYGERLHAQLHAPYEPASGERSSAAEDPAPMTAADRAHQLAMQRIGTTLRQHFGGWRACFLSPDPELPRQLGMQPRRRTPLFNGAIECRLFCFEIFDRPAR